MYDSIFCALGSLLIQHRGRARILKTAIKGFQEYGVDDAERYNRLRWWLGLTWAGVLDRATDLYPGKTGLVDDASGITYGELGEKTQRPAIGSTDLGIDMGDRVMVQIPNWNAYVYSFFCPTKDRCHSRIAASMT